MTEALIEIKNLYKDYIVNKNSICILNKINFSVMKGDIISIIGPSGSGKSTLLNILGLLDSNYAGEYKFLKQNVDNLTTNKKNILRNRSIGFVDQFAIA